MSETQNYSLKGVGAGIEIGEGGPRLYVESGNLVIRTNDGSALVKILGANGSGPDDFVTFTQLGTKQDTLVSGANIKTINGNSLLGSGNIVLGGTGTVTSVSVSGTASQILTSGSPITSSGTITVSLANNPVLPGTEGVSISSGTTAQRAVSPPSGQMRYNTTLTDYEGFLNSTWLPFGNLLQLVTADVLQGSVTTQIPFDNTTPLNTEGSLIATATITPKLATSKIIMFLTFMTDSSSSNRNNILTFFNGSTFIGATALNIATSGRPQNISLFKVFTAGVTTPLTLTARLGSGTASTTTYIQRAGGATFGGTNTTQLFVLEIK